MDRPISQDARRKRLVRRLLLLLSAAAALIVLWSLFAAFIRPSVPRSEIRTGKVDRGPIEATLTASGTVVPEYEQVLVSPIDTRVTRILKTPGTQLQAGEPIVELDVGEARLQQEKLRDQIALKDNERKRAELDLAARLDVLEGREKLTAVELKSLEHEVERNRRCFELGLFSEDKVRKAESDAERSRISLDQIRKERDHAREALRAQLEGLDLELGILRKELQEANHRLELAVAASDRPGVLTWVVPTEGAAVHRGEELARVADLNSFRVEATISDTHASKVQPGLPVIVQTGETRLTGRVAAVRPTVENGAVTFDVTLDEPRNPALRHNLRTEVYVVTSREENALRISRGQFPTVDGAPKAFVVRGSTATRRDVRFGLKNYDFYQVLEGLAEGEEVILSDMSDHAHTKEVRLR